MKGYDFHIHINDWGNPTNKNEILRVLKPFFQFVEIEDLKE